MKKRQKDLEQWQIEDAARLRDAFKAYKEKTGKSQMAVAVDCGWTQGNFSQYLHARIPLNWGAVKSLSDLFGIAPEQISPKIARENIVYAKERPAIGAAEPGDMTLTNSEGKTMFVPADLVDTVHDLITAWATSTVTKRQLHAYRTMFRADANIAPPPALPKEKPNGITKIISKLIPPDESSH